MAYDDDIAHRIRESLQGERGLTEQRMFGGLAFLVNGKIAVCASGKGGLLVRVDPAEFDAVSTEPHASQAIMGAREMKNWLQIDARAAESDDEFERWIHRGVRYARTLKPR